MVHDIVDVVENHCEEGLFRKPFGAQIRSENMSFAEARRLIHQTGINENLLIPDRVDLVNNLVRCYRRRSIHPVGPINPPPYRPDTTIRPVFFS